MQSLKSVIPYFHSANNQTHTLHRYLPLPTSSSASSGHPVETEQDDNRFVLATEDEMAAGDKPEKPELSRTPGTSVLDMRSCRRRRRSKTGVVVGAAAVLTITSALVGASLVMRSAGKQEPSWSDSLQTSLDAPSGEILDDLNGTAEAVSDLTELNLGPTYNPFRLSSLPRHPKHFPLLRPSRTLPTENDCLELWFSAGEICQVTGENQPLGPGEQLDIIQLWVNGSDPIWRAGLEGKSEQVFGSVRDVQKHYRDQGTLQYSLRSAAQNFAKGEGSDGSHVRKVHVLTADVGWPAALDDNTAGAEQCQGEDIRLGQIPSWMDRDALTGEWPSPATIGQPALQLHHHSEVFRFSPSVFASTAEPVLPWANESSWATDALPTFNSFAIESRVGWLGDLADTCIQANDDMFFHLPLSTADFWSPMYGSTFRLDTQYKMQVKPVLDSHRFADTGEWGGLQHANWLLSKRFYDRPRRYINHLPKTLTVPILHEAAILFPKDLALASARPFREAPSGQGDIELAFLITWLRIERYREALLWTWVVAKVGQLDGGMWAHGAREELKMLFGVERLTDDVEVWQGERTTLEHYAETFAKAGWSGPKQTVPTFSSMDGHLPDLAPPRGPPNFAEHCSVNFEHCFTREWLDGGEMPAADMFKRLTFDQWSCGDCLIKALVKQSGERGLSAFLPPKSAKVHAGADLESYSGVPTPHLPLVREWQNNSFAIQNIVNARTADPATPVYLRTWCMQLLNRYLYHLGSTAAEFTPVKSIGSAKSLIVKYKTRPDVAMSCINDDEPDSQAGAVGDILRGWMDETWSTKAWWERA